MRLYCEKDRWVVTARVAKASATTLCSLDTCVRFTLRRAGVRVAVRGGGRGGAREGGREGVVSSLVRVAAAAIAAEAAAAIAAEAAAGVAEATSSSPMEPFPCALLETSLCVVGEVFDRERMRARARDQCLRKATSCNKNRWGGVGWGGVKFVGIC